MNQLATIASETAATVAAEFGEAVVVTLAGVGTVSFSAIYERTAEVQDIGAMIEMDGVAAQLQCSSAAVTLVRRGDVAVVRSTTYKVVGIEAHRGGRTILVLGI